MRIKQWGIAAGIAGAIGFSAAAADQPVITPYDFGDDCFISALSDNGEWALTGMISESSAPMRIIKLATGEASTFPEGSCSYDITNDGLIVVGSHFDVASVYDVAAKEWKDLPVEAKYGVSHASVVTPDGRYAIGRKMVSSEESEGAVGALWDLTTMEEVPLKNLPKRSGLNSPITGWQFTDISVDGRYLLGSVDWNILLTSDSGVFLKYFFVYDRQTETWKPVGYNLKERTDQTHTSAMVEVEGGFRLQETGEDLGPWYTFEPQMPDLYMIDQAAISRNGRFVTGSAWFDDGENGYDYAFLSDMEKDRSEAYDDAESAYGNLVTDDGVVLAASPITTPVRECLIRGNGYWFPLSSILLQKYGYDFYTKTNYDNTGTPMAMTADNSRVAMMPDPYTSYILDLPTSILEMTEGVQLLSTYATNVPVGASMREFESVEITFNYEVESLAASSAAQIVYKKNDMVYKNSTGIFAEGRKLRVKFRKSVLEADTEYEIVLPAGAICIKNDPSQVNPEIRIPITGRADGAVKLESAYPADKAVVTHIDYSTNPVVLTFDTQVTAASDLKASLYRNDEETPFCQLLSTTGDNILYVYPPTTQYLFKDNTYRIEIPEGFVTDLSGNGPSEAITLNYTGSYVRELPTDADRLFYDDFSEGLTNFLLYDGDLYQPVPEMEEWGFSCETPWTLVAENDYSNFAAASHSMYTPAGQSDDWMVIPQLYITDKNCRLHFKAQSYLATKEDYLKIIVWPSDDVYESLSSKILNQMEKEGTVIFNELLEPQSPKGEMEGSWFSYTLPLTEFAGKNVYIAFVNQNDDQSVVFVDDIEVTRGLDYIVSLADTPENVVDQTSVPVKVTVGANSADKTYENLDATLVNADGAVVSRYHASISLKKGDRHDFAFPQELQLTVGEVNNYKVNIELNGEKTSVASAVNCLAFKPVKRVLLEEYTGVNCGYCPRGILAIERMEKRFGTQIIPVAIHTYYGDPWAGSLTSYSNFLGLNAAPSATVNRSYGSVMPMVDGTGEFAYFNTDEYQATGGTNQTTPSWEDYVLKELQSPVEAGIFAKSEYDPEAKAFDLSCEVRYAMNARNRNLHVFAVMVEDHLFNNQSNYLSTSTDPAYGEWGKGGTLGKPYIFGYEYYDVARATLGMTYQGTGGLLPADFEAGKTYEVDLGKFAVPSSVADPENCRIVVAVIDANTGKVINSHVANQPDSGVNDILAEDPSGAPVLLVADGAVRVETATPAMVCAYSADGRLLSTVALSESGYVEIPGTGGIVILRAQNDKGVAVLKAVRR